MTTFAGASACALSVVGGGIVGMLTAMQLLDTYPVLRSYILSAQYLAPACHSSTFISHAGSSASAPWAQCSLGAQM